MGIEGNDEADSLAKSTCLHPVFEVSVIVCYKGLKIWIHNVVRALLNEKWMTIKNAKLHLIRNDTFEKNLIFL